LVGFSKAVYSVILRRSAMLLKTSVAAALVPLASAQLHQYAKAAGLLYFGAATDSPGQRERAGLESSYPQYDAILRDTNEFGQTTPTNGQKVRPLYS
jgi:endo-1,4-beta-xylanase